MYIHQAWSDWLTIWKDTSCKGCDIVGDLMVPHHLHRFKAWHMPKTWDVVPMLGKPIIWVWFLLPIYGNIRDGLLGLENWEHATCMHSGSFEFQWVDACRVASAVAKVWKINNGTYINQRDIKTHSRFMKWIKMIWGWVKTLYPWWTSK